MRAKKGLHTHTQAHTHTHTNNNNQRPTLRGELLLDRDPHGNVQVSRIETERLLAGLVSARVAEHDAAGKGVPICTHFFGYEGRCALPSNFDVAYTAALGGGAAALVAARRTGLIVSITDLEKRAAEWGVGGHPIAALMTRERRRGKDKVVVRKALVELEGAPFCALADARGAWALEDAYAAARPSGGDEEEEEFERLPPPKKPAGAKGFGGFGSKG